MKDQYIFQINNNIIQYHKHTETFRICLEKFKDMCLMIDRDNYNCNNYYVLNKIPQTFKLYKIKLDKCDINSLKCGDLIYTPEKYKSEITEFDIQNNRYNFALVVEKIKDRLDIVRVLGNNIDYKSDIVPENIYKVTYEESNS